MKHNTSRKQAIRFHLLSRPNYEPWLMGQLVPVRISRAPVSIRPGSVVTFGPGSCYKPGPKGHHMRHMLPQLWVPLAEHLSSRFVLRTGTKESPSEVHLREQNSDSKNYIYVMTEIFGFILMSFMSTYRLYIYIYIERPYSAPRVHNTYFVT